MLVFVVLLLYNKQLNIKTIGDYMRKLTIILVAVFSLCCFLLSGCSCGCSQETDLTFSSLFYGKEGAPANGYTQTATYTVELSDSFNTEIAKDSQITDSIIKYDYNGTYTVKLEVLAELPSYSTLTGTAIATDLREGLEQNNVYIYKLTTSLVLHPEYVISGTAVERNLDFINTEAYFTPGESGFSPIYAETVSSISAIAISQGQARVDTLDSKCSTLYNKETYTVTKQYDLDPATTESYEYTQGGLVDNTQLLFVMRNINLDTKSQYELPVVSYQYGEPKNIMITNDGVGTTEEDINSQLLTVNGENYNQNTVKVKRYKYYLSDAKTTGIEQYVYLVNGENGNLGNRSFMYRYVEPLFAYESYLSLGALVYTLNDVTFSE